MNNKYLVQKHKLYIEDKNAPSKIILIHFVYHMRKEHRPSVTTVYADLRNADAQRNAMFAHILASADA